MKSLSVVVFPEGLEQIDPGGSSEAVCLMY